MLRNQLLLVLRHWFRYPVDTFIKVISLVAGITASLLILLFVQHEWRYDDFHSQRIYRVYYHNQSPSQDLKFALTPDPLDFFLKEKIPEVSQVARIREETAVVQLNDEWVNETVLIAKPNFFSIFGFKLQVGNPKQVLEAPDNVVITPALARKYFGHLDVLGKTLTLKLSKDTVGREFIVEGLTEELPTNTSIPFTMVLSSTLEDGAGRNSWNGSNSTAFVSLEPNSQVHAVEARLNRLLKVELDKEYTEYSTYHLQAIEDIHFGESVFGEILPPVDIRYFYIAVSVAIVLLIISCINYASLSLARSVNRSKEVGVRKSLGASRLQLVKQFMGESFTLTALTTLVSLMFIYMLLPQLSSWMGKAISVDFSDPIVISILAITVLFAGNIAGLYPSLILSKLSPSKVLKGQYIVGQRYRIIGLLVTFQFIGTSTLMIGSVGMYQQLSLLQNKELGFEKSAVIRLEVPFRPSENIYQQLRTQLSHFVQIENVTASWQLFGNEREGVGYQLLSWQVGEKNIEAYDLGVGPHFLETTKIKLIEGRSLSDWTEEPPHQILVNESFVKAMGWQDPLGKPIDHKFIFKTSEIVGVVEDFHFLSLHQPIRPLIIHPQSYYTNIYARVSSANLTSIIDIIEQKWKTVVPDIPFVYHFMDKDIALQYKNERRWTKVITYTTAMAVLVACLGLIGMGSLLTQQRTKEIGIRKVLGASIGNLILLLSRDYFKLIFAAFLIGTPVGNFLITEWLQNFAYRIQINGWIFVIPVLSILLIAVLSIGSLTYTAANKNPVDSLKYE